MLLYLLQETEYPAKLTAGSLPVTLGSAATQNGLDRDVTRPHYGTGHKRI